MRRNDFDEFAALLDATFDLIGKTPAAKIVSPSSKSLFFQALEEYSLPQVRAALGQHVKRGKFTPTPADIIEHIEAATNGDGRPGPEEAWAVALASQDERDTVVWTAETMQAWSLARPVMDTSGPITARKTFIESYARLVSGARAQRRPVQWSAHLGWDRAGQAMVLQQAVAQGLLSAPATAALLPPPPVKEAEMSEHARGQLALIKEMLAKSAADREERLRAKVERQNQDEEQFRRSTDQRVREYQKYIAMADQVQVRRAEGERAEQA